MLRSLPASLLLACCSLGLSASSCRSSARQFNVVLAVPLLDYILLLCPSAGVRAVSQVDVLLSACAVETPNKNTSFYVVKDSAYAVNTSYSRLY